MEWYHPLVRDLLVDDPDRKKLIFGEESLIFCGHPSTPAATSSDDHDLFLTQAEQLGGLSPADLDKTSPFIVEYIDGDTRAIIPSTSSYRTASASLIRAPQLVGSTSFATSMRHHRIPARIAQGQSLPRDDPVRAGAAPGARPSPREASRSRPRIAGTTVAPGSNVTVIVQTSGGAQPAAVLIMGRVATILVEQSPFKAILKIPDEAIGPCRFERLPSTIRGTSPSPTSPVNVDVTATLTSLEVINGDAVLERPGHTQQLTIIGNYSDGVRRNITAPELGTQYGASSLTWSPRSRRRTDHGVGPGYATIVIRHGTVITSINLTWASPDAATGSSTPARRATTAT